MQSYWYQTQGRTTKLLLEEFIGRKVWAVNASDVEWVQHEHINKTGTMIQLQAQIDQLRSTLGSLPKTKRTVTDPKIQSFLDSLTNTLSTEMNEIPTLQEIARKVARQEKMELDEKQYIAYEMIVCTFILGLVRDGND
jgi:hypothetical protein